MKNIIWVVMLTAAVTTGFIACSTSPTKNTTEKKAVTHALVPLTNNEIYTCTMHDEVMSDYPGECSKCGMTLVKRKMTPAQETMLKEGTYVKPKE
jgi:Heavy metal binding domain